MCLSSKKKINSLLIKPAGPDCNLCCEYCFYLEKSSLYNSTKKHRMSLDVLEQTIKQAMLYSDSNISFGWQGGEPTLLGLSFFNKVVEFQKKYGNGKTVGNGLQTNGILLNHDWAQFLYEYNFLVGLSLDGPKHIHDYYRKGKGGQGSWRQVYNAAKLLVKNKVATNALIVVNDYSANYPEEIYQFHKSLGLNYMQFISCVETDKNNPNIAAKFSVEPEKYGEFLIKIFDLWYNDISKGKAETSVRFFDSLFHTYIGLNAPDCILMKNCGDYLVVEHNGDVFCCDFFVEEKYKLGNILNGKLEDMLNSQAQIDFGNQKSILPNVCKECVWLSKCYGGCIKDRLRDARDNGVNHFCKSYKIFFNYTDEKFKMLALRWKQNQER